MEDLALSVLLLCLGCAAAFIGVFGDTLRDGPGPILRRITRTGWLTFACAALMLLTGVFQEVRAQSEAAEADEQMAKISSDAEAARKHLDELEGVLAAITAALDAMKSQLASLGSDPGGSKETIAHLEKSREAILASTTRAKILVGSHFNDESQRFDGARKAIKGVVTVDGAARNRYKEALRQRKPPFDAVMLALANDAAAAKLVRDYGAARTERYVKELGG